VFYERVVKSFEIELHSRHCATSLLTIVKFCRMFRVFEIEFDPGPISANARAPLQATQPVSPPFRLIEAHLGFEDLF
jgi:hypothetical protein